MLYYQLEIGTYGGSEKLGLALDNIANAIASNIPILYFVPICLRYYYDSEGEQQILSDIETHSVKNRSGEVITKEGKEFKKHISDGIEKIFLLQSLGVPIKIVMPIMDHEMLRPERMHTKVNEGKIQTYIQSVKKYGESLGESITVESSLKLFGIPHNNTEFEEILTDVRESNRRMYCGESKFRISESTFEHTVNEDYERNFQDKERNSYYRSREFARLCVQHGFGEDRVHTVEMGRTTKMNGYRGCFVKLPYGAETDMLIFNTEKDVVVTFEK